MADYSNNYTTGQMKWTTKTALATTNTSNTVSNNVTPPPVTNIISNLSSSSIQTSVQGQSIKILSSGITTAMFMLSEIVSWDLNSNQITIYSTDQLPLTLLFISIAEASYADDRLTIATNGGLLT